MIRGNGQSWTNKTKYIDNLKPGSAKRGYKKV